MEWTRQTLPGGTQHFGNGGFDAFIRIGDDELDATQTSASQPAQELGPDLLGLGGSDFQPEQFTPGATRFYRKTPIAINPSYTTNGDRNKNTAVAKMYLPNAIVPDSHT
jgi:hypothetical protein